MNTWDILHAHQKPINRNSANALSGGLTYSPSAKDHVDFDLPQPMKPFCTLNASQKDMINKKFFRLTVIGVSSEKSCSKPLGTRFVCKCECGNYTFRYRKPLLKTTFQACGECIEKRNRSRLEHHRKTGEFPSDKEIWEKMGSIVEAKV